MRLVSRGHHLHWHTSATNLSWEMCSLGRVNTRICGDLSVYLPAEREKEREREFSFAVWCIIERGKRCCNVISFVTSLSIYIINRYHYSCPLPPPPPPSLSLSFSLFPSYHFLFPHFSLTGLLLTPLTPLCFLSPPYPITLPLPWLSIPLHFLLKSCFSESDTFQSFFFFTSLWNT